jgi:Pyruvate/2-oxoglutarate dehydrogenase complex, dehydrogenase (E1) component, eukaryotic type, alpha subunit
MWRIRAFEERVGELARANEVHGLIHLSIGQEGVAAGVCGELGPATWSTATTARTGTRSPSERRWSE